MAGGIPPVADIQREADNVVRFTKRAADLYAWLHTSGYHAGTHADGRGPVDPAALVVGRSDVRDQLRVGARALRDAANAAARAERALSRAFRIIDGQRPSAGGDWRDTDPIKATDLRRAQRAQERRASRAKQGVTPWALAEVTG